MKLETFFERFDQFADAPDAGAKIRELVLHLAVTGTLVEQDSSDQSAEVLLEEISSERLAAVKSGLISPMKPLSAVGEDELSFELRPGWAPARLNQLVLEIQTGPFGSSLHKSDYQRGGTPVINPASIRDGKIIPIDEMAVGERTLKRLQVFKLRAGDIVMARRGEMGRCAIVTNSEAGWLCGTGSLVLRMPRSLHARYLAMLIGAPMARRYLGGASVGTTMQNLNQSILLRMPVGVPPLAEQKRIVAKVDELMALCDRLEAQQKERETRHAELARASLTRFADAPTPANLTFLFHKSYTIPPADLRKSILTLAVQGKLVPQDPKDEPVSESLSRNDQRRRATAKDDRRADDPNQTLLSAEDRWETAETWEWRGLADLVLFVDYRGKTPSKVAEGVRLLTAKNVRKGQINLVPEEFLSDEDYKAWMTRGVPKAGDVLFTTEAPMGNAAVVELTDRFALAQRVICFQSYGAVDPQFLVLQISSDQFQFILDKNGTGVTAKGIKASKLKRLPIAVPPLAEQRRIVAKVDQLMTLVDELETRLAACRATAAKLLDAIVSELTA